MNLNVAFKFLIISTVLCLLLFIIYPRIQPTEGEEAFYIALVGPMSGDRATEGQSMKQAVQLYLDQLNGAGGINGKKLLLDVYDDKNDKTRAREKALEIVEHNRAVAVIGHYYNICSIAGGTVYKKYGIPAISPASNAPDVTQSNSWYFATIFNNNLQATLLANYVNEILEQKTASIIYHHKKTYGAYLAQVFEEKSQRLGLDVNYKWQFNSDDINVDDRFKQIVNELQSKSESAGAIFLAVNPVAGIKLVKLIKDAGIRNPIICSDSLAADAFVDGFNHYAAEKNMPGYYTDGIYVVTPLIFDSANEAAQQFKEIYLATYNQEPGWHAAFAYDTAMVLVEAIKHTGIDGTLQTLKRDQRKIRDYLSELTDIDDALEGVTGFNYFNEQGDSPKPISIGVYKAGELTSAPIQLRAIRNLSEIADLTAMPERDRVLVIDNLYMYQTHVVYTGIEVNEISELNLNDLTCTLDFYVWFRYQGDIEIQDIEFHNATQPIELGKPINENEMAHLTYRLYHVKGQFKADFLLERLGFGKHLLGISFHHQRLNRHQLIFAIDTLGMGLTSEGDLATKMTRGQVLGPISGWTIKQSRLFEEIVEKKSLGHPAHLNFQSGIVPYSGFNLSIQIKQEQFTLRGMIPKETVNMLMVLSVVVVLLLAFTGQSGHFQRFSRALWIFQTLFAFLLLLSSEIVLVDWLIVRINPYYMGILHKIFDVLWWAIPALLLNLAIEKFIWAPLEAKTDRTIPNLARRFVAFIIYTLAFFGIVAFVFNQKLTSLLATSGVVAMIIGLAIQINISNIFSGIAINLERPFRIGDWVRIGNYEEGQVMDITWRTTRIQTRSNSILSIPNSTASESVIHNFNYPDDLYWVGFTVHIDSSHPPDRVQKILLDAVLSAEEVLKSPEPSTMFLGFGEWSSDYSVDFCIQHYERKDAYMEAVWKSVWTHLTRNGITPAIQRQEFHMFRGIEERGEAAKEPLTLLQEIDIFDPFPDEAKSALSQRMRAHHFRAGETIIRQGDSGDSLFIVVVGVVGVWVAFENQNPLEIARLGAGNFFGEMALLTGDPRTASVISVTDTHLFEIKKEDIAPLLEEGPELITRLSDVLSERQRALELERNLYQAGRANENIQPLRMRHRIQQFFGLGGSEPQMASHSEA